MNNTKSIIWIRSTKRTTSTMKAFVAFALLAVAAADNVYRPAPAYKPAPSYAPAYKPAPAYHEEPANYAYNYAVNDDYAGVNFNQEESRNGYATNGQYSVLLPDGRTQTVTYTVGDGYTGYQADVQYSGYAKEYQPAPAYKHAPAYKPAPRYHA